MTKGQRKKQRWEKQRAINATIREAERVASVQEKYKAPEFTQLKQKISRFVQTESMERVREIPSHLSASKGLPKYVKVKRPKGWAERKMLAAAETERKKKQVGVLYNKGGYQFIGDAPPEIIRGLGRKL